MTRFLRYSQEKGRKIRIMLRLDGKLAQKTALVISYDEENVTLLLDRRKTPVTLSIGDVFGCAYARGDSGED